MSDIMDTNGRAIEYLTFDLTEGETSEIIIIKVRAGAGRVFKSASDARVTLEGRYAGSGGSFTDLATGLDLSGFTVGLVRAIEVRAVAGTITGRERVALPLALSRRTAAGWAS